MMLQSPKAINLLEKSLLLRGGLIFFVPFWPSTGWTRPTHIMEGDLLYYLFTC